ncbi:hypothetical protein EVAR_22264_1 [Eumeta japonica]|uniref:Uncharacterized protein n=1 Tax=Eumeta variegata TaxID=151549 RepID=A0A4C1UAG6_EUMVA|nr:hypothetical protein EVAR_22264_1 [Eumeta japonica]
MDDFRDDGRPSRPCYLMVMHFKNPAPVTAQSTINRSMSESSGGPLSTLASNTTQPPSISFSPLHQFTPSSIRYPIMNLYSYSRGLILPLPGHNSVQPFSVLDPGAYNLADLSGLMRFVVRFLPHQDAKRDVDRKRCTRLKGRMPALGGGQVVEFSITMTSHNKTHDMHDIHCSFCTA